jgi:hypothetical protein
VAHRPSIAAYHLLTGFPTYRPYDWWLSIQRRTSPSILIIAIWQYRELVFLCTGPRFFCSRSLRRSLATLVLHVAIANRFARFAACTACTLHLRRVDQTILERYL